LLQSGVDLAVIALWLGHERTETTHLDVEADLATKEHALQKRAPAGMEVPRFRAKDDGLAFLATL
jgi:integrase/recombinase XerD